MAIALILLLGFLVAIVLARWALRINEAIKLLREIRNAVAGDKVRG